VLILASASPRRRELLARLGLHFSVEPADIDEQPRPGEEPDSYAERVAQAKAACAAAVHPFDWILAADTTVALGAQILGKPVDEAEARAMLEALAGRTHRVITAYCLRSKTALHSARVVTEVDVAPLGAAEIAAYLRCGEWRGKAGAYAIQGVFAYAVSAVRGSYTNVVGLPLHEVLRDALGLGALTSFPGDFGG
jgi:septum formation protein